MNLGFSTYQWVFLISNLCNILSHGFEMMVNDSLILNLLIPSLTEEHRNGLYTEIWATVNQSHFSGFLLVISNQMRIDSDSCALFGDIFSLELNHDWIPLSCSHYMVRYVPTPLRIRFIPAIFTNLSNKIRIVLTAIRFSCPPFHGKLRQCPNFPIFCIPRHLFCDSVDNCGARTDEEKCSKLTSSPISMNHSNQKQMDLFWNPLNNHQSMLILCLAMACFLSTGTLIVLLCRNLKPKRRPQPKISVCPRIEISSENDVIEQEEAARKKQSVVRKFISSFKSQKVEEANEVEETVALLTLGLKNVLYTLPTENFNDEVNGGVPERSYHYSASSSSSSDSIPF